MLRLGRRDVLVISCDSIGAIGSKHLDRVKCSPFVVGQFAARVALMEVLAVGGTPICIACPLAVEPSPTGKRIIMGVRTEMRIAGLTNRVRILDSTEKNFEVDQTGIGITVVGRVDIGSLRVGRCQRGDQLFAVGLPCVGTEVLSKRNQRLIANTQDLRKLLELDAIHEVIPVGSRGILHEARVIARDSKLSFKLAKNVQISMTKSAGPATVILFAGSISSNVKKRFHKPVTKIGSLA